MPLTYIPNNSASPIINGKSPFKTLRKYIYLREQLPIIEYPLGEYPLISIEQPNNIDKITIAIYKPTGDKRLIQSPDSMQTCQFRKGSYYEYEYEYQGSQIR
jgi:hypothetical protein